MSKWTDHEIRVLRENFVLGFSDAYIALLLPNRTDKSVQAKRKLLRLLAANYPERPNPWIGRSYTVAENEDILSRHNSGESYRRIADAYAVSPRAMEGKIDRLKNAVSNGRNRPAFERICLGCAEWFSSHEPRKINRLCPNCSNS